MVGAEAIRDNPGPARVPEQEDRKELVNNSNGQQAYAWVMVGMFGACCYLSPASIPEETGVAPKVGGMAIKSGWCDSCHKRAEVAEIKLGNGRVIQLCLDCIEGQYLLLKHARATRTKEGVR
jgi:predicted CXXCH cytochrome family protein